MSQTRFSGPVKVGTDTTIVSIAGDDETTLYKGVKVGEATANLGRVVCAQSNTLAYTDTTAKDLFTLPAGSQILEIYVDVLTAFNSSGTDLVDIGKSGSANLYADNLDVSSAARLRATSDVSQIAELDDIGTSAVTIQGIYAQSVADASAGSARVTVVYVPGQNLE